MFTFSRVRSDAAFLFFLKKNALFLGCLLHSIKIHLTFTSLNNEAGRRKTNQTWKP